MPSEDIQVKALPPVRVAHADGVAGGFEPASIGPVIQPLYDRLCADLDKAGVPMVGPALAWYDDAPDGGVLVHAGMPVEAEPGTYDGFTVTDLPAVELAATIVHCGPMDDVMPTIQTLAQWIDANGYTSAGYNRELYVSYGEGPGPWEVELQEPVRAG